MSGKLESDGFTALPREATLMDITSKIDDARSPCSGWTHEKVRYALLALARLYPEGAVDWEEGDEEWGRVISRGEATAYMSARCPLAFVRADDEAAVGPVSSRLGIIAVAVQDFDDPSISVDPVALSNLTGRSLTENVSYGRASLNEIRWATV